MKTKRKTSLKNKIRNKIYIPTKAYKQKEDAWNKLDAIKSKIAFDTNPNISSMYNKITKEMKKLKLQGKKMRKGRKLK